MNGRDKRRKRRARVLPMPRTKLPPLGPITGCSYGVHPFVYAGEFAMLGMHLHECPLCGASYIHPGTAPCTGCAS